MNAYGTVLTRLGEELIARALQEGGRLDIAAFAVGDGGGEALRPDPAMTALRGEQWRGPIRSVEIAADNPGAVVVDMLVPAEVGGFTIREAGVFDGQGNLIAVMNTPTTVKVPAGNGMRSEQFIEMVLAVSATEAIALSTDPSLVLATRAELAAHDEDVYAHETLRVPPHLLAQVTHDRAPYPQVCLYRHEHGWGLGGWDAGPFGGSELRAVPAGFVHTGPDRLEIYVGAAQAGAVEPVRGEGRIRTMVYTDGERADALLLTLA